MTEQITSADFREKILESSEPVLVDFYATWCSPCRMIAPVVDEIAREVAGKARVYQLDIDENPDIAKAYRIASVPTLVVFKGGEPYKRTVGASPKATILRLFD